jgi:hypothetical protein
VYLPTGQARLRRARSLGLRPRSRKPAGDGTARQRAIHHHSQGEHDHGRHVLPPAGTALMPRGVERRVQQPDRERILPPESASWVPSRYRKNGATRASRPRSRTHAVQIHRLRQSGQNVRFDHQQLPLRRGATAERSHWRWQPLAHGLEPQPPAGRTVLWRCRPASSYRRDPPEVAVVEARQVAALRSCRLAHEPLVDGPSLQPERWSSSAAK